MWNALECSPAQPDQEESEAKATERAVNTPAVKLLLRSKHACSELTPTHPVLLFHSHNSKNAVSRFSLTLHTDCTGHRRLMQIVDVPVKETCQKSDGKLRVPPRWLQSR